MRNQIRSPLRWVGGKSRLVDWLRPHLDIRCSIYCEPFGGSAALLLNREPVKVEVYNDSDGGLATLMLCVRDHPGELQRLVAGLPYSRQFHRSEVDWLKRGCPGRMTDLQFAARWWWLNLAGFSGFLDRGFGIKTGSNMPQSIARQVLSIDTVSHRLRDVLIENDDFRAVVKRYDTPSTLFYCDPPYVGSEGVYREGNFGEEDHRDLARMLNAIKGFAAVSYFPCPLIDELYPADRWRRIKKRRFNSLGAVGAKKQQCTELLLLNYEIAACTPSRGPIAPGRVT